MIVPFYSWEKSCELRVGDTSCDCYTRDKPETHLPLGLLSLASVLQDAAEGYRNDLTANDNETDLTLPSGMSFCGSETSFKGK